MKLVIVIILDDRETELTGQVEQPQAAIRLQRNRGWKLMVRSQEDRSDAVRATHPLHLLHIDALLVEAHQNDLRTAVLQNPDRLQISQGLDEHHIARPYEHPSREAYAHLTTARNADIVRGRHEPSLRSEHRRDCFPQKQRATGIAV